MEHKFAEKLTKVQEQLISLLRTAINGGEGDLLAIGVLGWDNLLAEASRHGLKGLLWSMIQSHPACASALSFEEKMEWYGNVNMAEAMTSKMWNKANEFAHKIYEQNQTLRCIVLKGIDYAHFWPNPLHREFGDLDSWYGNDFDLSNEIAKSIGAEVDFHAGGKHTHTHYKGLTIENHKDFTDRLSKMELMAEQTLREFLDLKPVGKMADCPFLYSPNENFTALYMVMHAKGHFDEGIRLKHVLDWLFFVRAKQAEIDWSLVIPAMKKLKLYNFACCLTEICTLLDSNFNEILNQYFSHCPNQHRLSEKMLEDIMGEQPEIYDMRLWKKALRILRRFRRLWTFRALSSENYFYKMWTSLAYNSVTGLKPKFA